MFNFFGGITPAAYQFMLAETVVLFYGIHFVSFHVHRLQIFSFFIENEILVALFFILEQTKLV